MFVGVYRVVFLEMTNTLKIPKNIKFYTIFQFAIFLNTISKQPEY